ncbi:MAG: DUF2380 domain-containing protein, partial [Alphaproteobacteria bacterium]
IARTQGKDAALKAAGIEIGTFVVGGVVVKGAFKVGKVAYKSAEAAWAAYVAENPIMAKLGNTVASAVERGKTWAGVGASEKILALPEPKFVKHHIFNKFRGTSQQSEKYRQFFKKHDIQVDSYTVEIPEGMYRLEIHVAENNWTTKWKQWIDQNPNATTKEVYQFAGQMMDNYKLNNLPLVPYKGK